MASPPSSSFAGITGIAGSRRAHPPDATPAGAHWLFGRHRLDLDRRELLRDEHRLQLDERAFAVLTCLLRHAEHVVPRATLVAEAWPGIAQVNDSAVSKSMRRLRIALGSDAARTLVTVYGVGYRLATPATLVPAGAIIPSGGSAANGAAVSTGVPAPAEATQDRHGRTPSQPAPAAGVATGQAGAPARMDRTRRQRIVAAIVVLLGGLLAAWLLLAPVVR